ncbi:MULTISPECIES: branched-chain amino acid ABC transporter permease [unclassified Pseudofrankia]|uniref:branched-chain amino acid ABC transporter permease n=1 Tax=unclassified Pseudofrankia TaxID=2994372 RepID=UPI0008D9DBAB|nr:MULTISPECIES: hypothetical protein [unclassified Pseudofrankia]MDT3441833.1 hypothetical protein [Pseudofrankia sp. BMG5.37]OHV47113.1 hypothetical protein BCD48_20495 [Pseudofrankia sp. BMG5.36]
MDNLVVQSLGVLGSAALLALITVGLAVSFGLMRIVNLAHGEFIMLGAYAAMVTADHELPWLAGLAAATAVGLAVGSLTEVALIRRLYRSPELSILGTFGLSIVVRQLVELAFGKQYRNVANPMPGAVELLGVSFPAYRLLLIAIAVGVLALVLAALRLTPLGLRVRAVAADADLAETLGVRSQRLNLAVFAGSAALAGLAGALVAPLVNVQPDMGVDYLFGAFLGVIVAGSRLGAVVVACLAIATVQNIMTFFTDPMLGRLSALALAFVVLQARRRAAFGEATA